MRVVVLALLAHGAGLTRARVGALHSGRYSPWPVLARAGRAAGRGLSAIDFLFLHIKEHLQGVISQEIMGSFSSMLEG